MARRPPAPEAVRVAVLGSGSWGTSFSTVLAEGGAAVTIWARRPELAREIDEASRNSDYLPGVNLPATLRASPDLGRVLAGAEHVFVALPSQSVRAFLTEVQTLIPGNCTVVSLMKGVERSTQLRMSQVVEQSLEISADRIAVLSGPNLALEIARGEPTSAVVSSQSLATAQSVARVASNGSFRSFVNTDVIGTEFGGVLKNLIAVAIGIVDGVGYGENTKASIITRGLVEMTEFAVAFGAEPATLAGLAGLGDLIATCQSPLSRNNTAGRLLGQGYSLPDVIERMNQTAEGLTSIEPVLALARSRGVAMPIVEQVSQVLRGTLAPKDLAPHLTGDDEPAAESIAEISVAPRPRRWNPFRKSAS